MKEIVIEIRPNALSIQGNNIQGDTNTAKKVLQDALDALNQKPTSTHTNELVFNKKK